jgi:hypothetical protein
VRCSLHTRTTTDVVVVVLISNRSIFLVDFSRRGFSPLINSASVFVPVGASPVLFLVPSR